MSTSTIAHYINGAWHTPSVADATPLLHAINGQVVAHVGNESLDFESILAYGREIGNTNLRRLTFQQRGLMLKRLALHLLKHKETFYEPAGQPVQRGLMLGLISKEELETCLVMRA